MSDDSARFCTFCKKKVFPIRTFTKGVVLLLVFVGVLPGILYYYLKERKCPYCKNADWDATHE